MERQSPSWVQAGRQRPFWHWPLGHCVPDTHSARRLEEASHGGKELVPDRLEPDDRNELRDRTELDRDALRLLEDREEDDRTEFDRDEPEDRTELAREEDRELLDREEDDRTEFDRDEPEDRTELAREEDRELLDREEDDRTEFDRDEPEDRTELDRNELDRLELLWS